MQNEDVQMSTSPIQAKAEPALAKSTDKSNKEARKAWEKVLKELEHDPFLTTDEVLAIIK